MLASTSSLQFSNNAIALTEWFLASVGLVVAITLLYVFVLNRSPAPSITTVSKVDESLAKSENLEGLKPALERADQSLKAGSFIETVEESAEVALMLLRRASRGIMGKDLEGAGIADLAYIVQTKSKAPVQIAEPMYQLNSLRLKAIQGHPIEDQEAAWAVSVSKWLVQLLGQR